MGSLEIKLMDVLSPHISAATTAAAKRKRREKQQKEMLNR